MSAKHYQHHHEEEWCARGREVPPDLAQAPTYPRERHVRAL